MTGKRLAVLQYGNDDGSFRPVDYSAYGLQPVTLCCENDQREPAEHAVRAASVAATLPAGSVFVVNAEHYGAKNVDTACNVLSHVVKANPLLLLSAYLPEQTLPFWDAVGQGSTSRVVSVARVVETTKRLAGAGANFASIDGYAPLGKRASPVKHWGAATWFETWSVAIGQAAAVVEPFMRPCLWISNRVIPNGRVLKPGAVEPHVGAMAFLRMFTFAEARGWGTISLLGWSDTLRRSTGRGFLPLAPVDEADLINLKTTPITV